MSEPMRRAEIEPGREPGSEKNDVPEKGSGPNLVLLYALLALALLTAMGIAAMIVWPFYKAR